MTISETGDRGGFTLVEIILALALIALLSTLFVGGGSALLADKPLSPDAQFLKVCADTRRAALEGQRDVTLSYDGTTRAYVVNDGTAPRSIPVGGSPDLIVDFLPSQSASNAILIGGNVVESNPISHVTFYSDGTCTPFRAQFRVNGTAHVLGIDPWTCAPMLSSSDAKS